jgi:pyruvate/2-oxoglutarate dehydrogenase complex dihydrolipoamide acyltransferase (E2) component
MEYDQMDAAIAWARERWPNAGAVLSRATYADRIALVFEAGYKVTVPLVELQPEPEDAESCPSWTATVAAVRYAQQRKIDLKTITGTGKDGKITLSDVREAIDADATV